MGAYIIDPPSAEELPTYYNAAFFDTSQQTLSVDENGDILDSAKSSALFENCTRRLNAIRAKKTQGRLLDVGCGKGFFLKVCEPYFQVEGSDISQSAADFAKNKLGLLVHAGDFNTANAVQGPYDIVTMWDVLASFRDPDRCVEKVSEILAPEGLFVLTVPDIESLCFRLTRKYWPLLIPPINLFYFSQTSLRMLFQRHGLRILHYEHKGKRISSNFILRKLGRILNLPILDRENIYIPFFSEVYLNLGDIAHVYAVKEGSK
jgi:predicted TPR repeat methyltransferase